MTGRGDNPKDMFLSFFLNLWIYFLNVCRVFPNLLVEGVAKTPDFHATKPERGTPISK